MTFCVGGLDRTPSGVKRGKVVILAQWLIYGLQIRGWGPYPEMRGGPGLKKISCRPFGPQLGLKIKGGGWAPLDPALLHHFLELFEKEKRQKR